MTRINRAWKKILLDKEMISEQVRGDGDLDWVVVPVPPSANNLFLNTKNKKRPRAKTDAYRKWIDSADDTIAKLKPPTKFPCEVVLRCGVKIHGARDIANIEKAIIDALVRQGVIPKDSIKYVSDVVIRYRPQDNSGGVTVFTRTPSEE